MNKIINLEILDVAFIYADTEIEALNTKELVPKMVTRRRLTRAAKIVIYLADKVSFKEGRIVYGSSFGELTATANILNAIKNKEGISPTHFQNSVYNTAVSYLSMLYGNTNEILTVSSGANTSLNVLKSGAIKAMDGDEILLLATETLNIDGIEEVNNCLDYLECGVALKVKMSEKESTIDSDTFKKEKGLPLSVQDMFVIAQNIDSSKKNIIEVRL